MVQLNGFPVHLSFTFNFYHFREVPQIRPPIVLIESDLNSEQVSLINLMRPTDNEKRTSVLKQVVLLVRVILISSGFNSRTLQ